MYTSELPFACPCKIQVLTEKLLLKFAQFTNQVLRISESSTSASASRKSTLLDRGTTHLFSKVCIESTLDAMSKFSSLAASEFFIRCVYLLDSAGMNEAELSSSFQLKSADVPAWMFLRWLPQLTSLLSKPNLVKPVGDLLLRVAQEYPSALRLPIALSSEQYHVQNSGKSLTSSLNSVVSRQVSMTKSELFSLFMEELQRLEEPSFIFKTWLFEFKAVFDERSSLGVSELKQRFQKMVSLCLYPNSSSRFGSFGQKFARAHSANIFQICGGRNGDTLMKMTRKDLDELLVYFANKIRHDTSTGGPGPKTLKSFSPWLYAYSSGNFLEDLEIPGQYENITQRPDLRSIVRLEKVNESILQLASIRKPKRLVMLGSDGVEYPWLVKAGEDIRLDQRVQQLFSVMNSALSKSSSYCERHYIRLRTFKVVPMSTKLGILEWMSGTRTLRDCMIKSSSSSLSSTSSSFEVDDANAFIELQKSLTKHATKKTANRRNLGLDAELYAAFNKNASRDDSIRGIRAAVSQMTRSYLRSYFYQIAAAPENFIVLRNNFVQSLAAINVCSYILGIGDRHLENLLIDTTR